MNDRFENGRCGVVVALNSKTCFVELESDAAMTLVATLSDDPDTWSEIESLWPRYKTPVVVQEISALPLTWIASSKAPIVLSEYVDWAFIDLDQKRLITSESLGLNGSNCAFDLFNDDCENRRWPLSIHLPPWWEVHAGGTLDYLRVDRQQPLASISVNRDLLYGPSLLNFIASRISEVAGKPFLRNKIVRDTNQLYAQTVEVHRDWLMTPRIELAGKSPRHLLHGGLDWLDRVVNGQTLRARAGLPLVAYPNRLPKYLSGPMGSEEVIIYFDLCRHLIEYGWSFCRQWFKKRGVLMNQAALKNDLCAALLQAKLRWLKEPFEGGASPQFILDCSRGRVPRSSSFSIEGIEGHQPAYPLIDCECVVCQMMANGSFGPSFASLDGHHLELDEEFAFSMFETREQWEEEQQLLGSCLSHEVDSDEELNSESPQEKKLAEENSIGSLR